MANYKVRATIVVDIEADDASFARQRVEALLKHGTIRDAFSEIDADVGFTSVSAWGPAAPKSAEPKGDDE